jgi:hypothetical protein
MGISTGTSTSWAAADPKANAKAVASIAKKNAKKITTQYKTEKGKVYDVYRGNDGRYFIVDTNNKISYFTNKNAIAIFDADLNKTVSKDTYELFANQLKRDKEYADSQAALNQAIANLSNLGASNNTADAYWSEKYDKLMDQYKEATRVMSAEEAAKKFGIDYNEANILKGYDEASNKKFDELTTAQSDLREQALRNNAQYIKQTADAYLDSYRNAAPTATGRGTLAANMLSNMINASDTLSYNDYGMMQSINALEEERKKELANNKMLAKDYYTNMGLYLSTLTANKNTADVQANIANLDKYAKEYAASRQTAAANAAAAASRYAGLAQAAGTNAGAAANSALAKYYQYYNMYLNTMNGDTKAASSALVNNHLNAQGY